MHVTNWAEVQGEDVLLAACWKWMSTRKNVPLQKKDALLRTCMGEHSDSEEGKALFRIRNSFAMKKGMLYVRPKDCWPLWFLPHIGVQLSMACTEMPDTTVSKECWH